MSQTSTFEKRLGQPLSAFVELDPDQRAAATRAAVPDLNAFLEPGAGWGDAETPARTRELARSLFETLGGDAGEGGRGGAPALRERIVTEAFLRSEADRDQNVYLGRLFTRVLTHAVPDLIFQPISVAESARALRWARHHGVPVTLRGAASTAMGGAVPNDGGLTLDVSRLDTIEIDAADRVCVVGAGARLRTIHRRLAAAGLALTCYPSNLGGTLAGWFVTGGVGLNAYGRGRAAGSVRAADVLLPSGDHVRFHDDGRIDVPDGAARRKTLAREESAAWFTAKGLVPLSLVDLAGSEGAFGLVLHLTVSVEPRPAIGAFLLAFESAAGALGAVAWIRDALAERFGAPANLKLLDAAHLHHVRRVWKDDEARPWRARPGAWSDGAAMPWTSITGPRALGATCAPDFDHAAAYLFVDFLDLAEARRFAQALGACPGAPRVLDEESARFAAERFRPMQVKRLGPGLLAAEILMPAAEVGRFLPRAERLAANVGSALDSEVYFLADGEALVIGGYLTDHRRGSFAVDLMIAPVLVDLAMRRHRGRPYVLGRWQAAWLERKLGREGAQRARAIKRALDQEHGLNRGVMLGMRLHGALGALLGAGFAPGVALLRAIYDAPALAWLARIARAVLASVPGPAHGRGAPAVVGAPFQAGPPAVELAGTNGSGHGAAAIGAALAAAAEEDAPAASPREEAWLGAGRPAHPAALEERARNGQPPTERALHCVNCGECNSVCPIFHESKIRLPQMLTHLGEALEGGAELPLTGSVLLDLCMRCGNCEEVCQAGIPHLPLYQVMQRASDATRPRDRERHAAIVATVRGSTRYTRDFLDIRPGGYRKRAPVALPGVDRFLVLRAENDAGPGATCIHCGACVPVCPTHANRDFEGADPRWITTEQDRCIGCGACVEVCPANLANDGQTLRVMEAPTRDWFQEIERFEASERP